MEMQDQYDDIEKKLMDLASPGIHPGLARLSRLLSLAGNPERAFKAVHIVGTNGKGSTAATLASILSESGYKTALYTSPHLVSFGERLQVNGVSVPRVKWDKYIEKIEKLINSCDYLRDDRPTYFELITAAAFMIIKDENIDIAVVEAGMGGRLDATNIIKNVILTVITPIGIDHIEYLGSSLADIAKEKFAVMRPAVPAIFAGGEPEVENIFFESAEKSKTPAQVLRRLCSYGIIQTTLNGTDFYIEAECMRNVYHTPLIGSFQADNSALAVTAANAMRCLKNSAFKKIDLSSIYSGVANTCWPGRFELLREKPVLICDGAHNPHGINRLVETILMMKPKTPVNIVLAMMKDKDTINSLKLFRLLDAVVYCTQVPGMERCMPAEELFANAAEAGLKTTCGCYKDPLDAIKKSLSEGSFTVCCGSLYLVGYIKGNIDVIQRF
jgi:dihydrofolate synthase/folylpolyglutamate synthase